MSKTNDTIIIVLLVLIVALQAWPLLKKTVDQESYCDSDSQCPSGQKCRNSFCVPK